MIFFSIPMALFLGLAVLTPQTSCVPLNTQEIILIMEAVVVLHSTVLTTVTDTTADNILLNGPLIDTGIDALAAAFTTGTAGAQGSLIRNITEQGEIERVMRQIVDIENMFVSGLLEKRLLLIDAGFRQSTIASVSRLLGAFQSTGPVVFDALPDTHDVLFGIYNGYELPLVNLTIDYGSGAPGVFQ